MADTVYLMTAIGKAKIEADLENLILVERPKIIERIKIARSYGDLSENSEYEGAKDEQGHLESKIKELQTQLKYAQIVDVYSVDADEIILGKKVTFTEVGEDEEEEYIIVGSYEANPDEGKISNDSPIAKALIGKRTGDIVSIPTPNGSFEVKINKVEIAD